MQTSSTVSPLDRKYVLSQLVEHCSTVLSQYPITAAYLFGSVNKNKARSDSDIDIALVFNEEMTSYDRLFTELRIQSELEGACQVNPIDCRSIDNAPLMIKGRIIQEGTRIFEGDRERRIEFEVMTRKFYFDYLPTARMLQKAFINNVRENGLVRR